MPSTCRFKRYTYISATYSHLTRTCSLRAKGVSVNTLHHQTMHERPRVANKDASAVPYQFRPRSLVAGRTSARGALREAEPPPVAVRHALFICQDRAIHVQRVFPGRRSICRERVNSLSEGVKTGDLYLLGSIGSCGGKRWVGRSIGLWGPSGRL